MIYTPRPYQETGINDIFESWKTHDVLMFVLATGGGKTVTFMEVARRFLMRNLRVMVIAHREELIMGTWQTLYNSRIYAGIIKAEYPKNYDLRCQVASIQTLARRKDLPPADLIIIDEAHHVQDDNSYGKILALYPAAKVLMVTATPYRLSGDGFLNVVPGKTTHLIVNQTLKDLILGGWLVPIKYFVASIPDLSDVGLAKGEYKEEDAERVMTMAPLVQSYLDHCKGMKGIIFAVNVNHSLSIVKQYDEAGINIKHLDANTNKFDRQRIVQELRSGDIDGVSNVGILTEGADFPNIQFAQLGRPTMSLSLALQMIGRTTRALAGVVDGWNTDEERRNAIARSEKPHAIILDNAGCWQQHGLPDDDHDWGKHFRGEFKRKNKDVDEEMEMLVFVAEDSNGKMVKTKNPKEVEGMTLIEVTHEVRKKVVNIVSIKEFERMLQMGIRLPKIKSVGYFALKGYLNYCKKNNILVSQEIWEHLHQKLVVKPKERIAMFEGLRTDPDQMVSENRIAEAINETTRTMMASGFFRKMWNEYIEKNYDQYTAQVAEKNNENKFEKTLDFNN